MFRYEYIGVFDIDEVIMPLQQSNWHDLITEIKRTTPLESDDISTLVFRHALFLDNVLEEQEVEEDIPEWLHMMNHVYRSVNYFPPGYNVKSFHSTERTQVVHNHYGLFCLGPCQPHHVDPSLGQLQHYRRGCPVSISKEDCSKYYEETVKDTTIWRIKDQVINNSLATLRNVNINSTVEKLL